MKRTAARKAGGRLFDPLEIADGIDRQVEAALPEGTVVNRGLPSEHVVRHPPRCVWPRCRFAPAWRVLSIGRPDRDACTTHLGLVCGDGNPQTALSVRLLAAIARDGQRGAVS